MCLARSTPHTGSSGAQGLWSEFTAKPQLAAPKGSAGPRLGRFLRVMAVHESGMLAAFGGALAARPAAVRAAEHRREALPRAECTLEAAGLPAEAATWGHASTSEMRRGPSTFGWRR